jgi:hypothetical protein
MSILLNPDEFDNEYIEDFWDQCGSCSPYGSLDEEAIGRLKMVPGKSNSIIYANGSSGNSGTQLFQSVAYNQDFDVVIKTEVGTNFFSGGSYDRTGFGLMWKSASATNTTFCRIMRGTRTGGGGDIGDSVLAQRSILGSNSENNVFINDNAFFLWLRLTRVGDAIQQRWSYDGVSWFSRRTDTSSDLRAAGEVGMLSHCDPSDSNDCWVHSFRNFDQEFKFAGTISHDGWLYLLPNDPNLNEWGTVSGTYPFLVSTGSWEIYTAWSGIASVVGRRDSDDKVVGVGGLTPILVP